MTLYIIGDTHGPTDSEKLWDGSLTDDMDKMTRDDVVFVLGDFGWCFYPTSDGKEAPYETDGLSYIESMPYTTVFIDGNHENFPRLYQYPEADKFGGKVGVLRPHIFHLKQRGHIYDICGHKIWCMGGAPSFDKAMRTPELDWWPEEIPTMTQLKYGIQQLKNVNWAVDYIFTHDGPADIVCCLLKKNGADVDREQFMKEPVAGYLQRIAAHTSFKHWYFGHHHMDVNLTVPCIEYQGSKAVVKQFTCLMDTVATI